MITGGGLSENVLTGSKPCVCCSDSAHTCQVTAHCLQFATLFLRVSPISGNTLCNQSCWTGSDKTNVLLGGALT